jgi:hypothetical protein
MPNWCWNSLEISGDKKHISKFKKVLNDNPIKDTILKKDFLKRKKEYLLEQKESGFARENLNTYLKYNKLEPKKFVVDVLGYTINEKGNAELEEELGMLAKFYPEPNYEEIKGSLATNESERIMPSWWNFRVNYWGTKWDVDIDIATSDDDFIHITFDSAWSPPVQWLYKVAQDYPNLDFKLEYEESGVGFKGVLEIDKATLIKDETREWYGDCWECETEYTTEGHCKCVDDNGKKLVWGEESEDDTEDNPCAV